jgi:NAD(P)-dependent dehydrogenase (short-subunit alcohol dehydrogenase family)
MVRNEPNTTSPRVPRDLEGRRAIVTGGSRGIGAAVVERLAAAGADVVAVARSVRVDTPDVHFIAGDLRTKDGADAIAAAAMAHLGGVDIIVNNAGASRGFPAGSLTIEPDAWQEDLDANFLSAVRLNAALVPQMLERGSGAIVHIASSAAFNVPAPLLHYGASKAALIAYSKGLATELAPKGVRVNTITPGPIETPGADKGRAELAAAFGIDPQALLASVPVGRIGRAGEIAEAVAYLVSERAAFTVGANLVIDGGEQRRP